MLLIRKDTKAVTNILAVDDNPASLRLLDMILTNAGYSVSSASNGKEALDYLRSHPEQIDIILLDRMMPVMDGLELCCILKKDSALQSIPIIMQTAADKPEEISEGIKAGVFYYLTKPLNNATLLSVVESAEKQMKHYKQMRLEVQQQRQVFGLVSNLKCRYRDLKEADILTTFLATFFPDPARMITGISELLINAVEHGNLGIGYAEKSELISKNEWQQEVERRLGEAGLADKWVTVLFERKEDTYLLQITDEGEGFDWMKYLEVDLSRATHNHGRGIAMANMLSFDRLIYNDKGNQVTCMVIPQET